MKPTPSVFTPTLGSPLTGIIRLGITIALCSILFELGATAAGVPTDAIQPNSIWQGKPNYTLTILERDGDTFRARFEVGSKIVRELSGTVSPHKISWLAKNVHAIKGNPGGDNFGVVAGDTIDFTWRNDQGVFGKPFTLLRVADLDRQNVPAPAVTPAPGAAQPGSPETGPDATRGIPRTPEALQKALAACNPDYGANGKINVRNGRIVGIDLAYAKVEDITPLAGLPLKSINLTGTRVGDLTALRGMPLEILKLSYCTKIEDLSPLKDMPLRELRIYATSVADFSPLADMPLVRLYAGVPPGRSYARLPRFHDRDLALLKGLRIKRLGLPGARLEDLSPLNGMALQMLNLNGCVRVKNLGPLSGMPIQMLSLGGTSVRDFSLLADMPLRSLNVANTCFRDSDLAALHKVHLISLNVQGTMVGDISPLRNMPLKRLVANHTAIADISALEGLPLVGLALAWTDIKNIDVLNGKPMKFLNLRGTSFSDRTRNPRLEVRKMADDGSEDMGDEGLDMPEDSSPTGDAEPQPAQSPAAPPGALLNPAETGTSCLDVLSNQAPNAGNWVLAPLNQTLPPGIRQNLTWLREDLLDEASSNPTADQDAYGLGCHLCNALIVTLDERDQALVHAGYRAAQADANTAVTSQALEARRNYMMSWPQYARERDQRAEIRRQQNDRAALAKKSTEVEWSKRAGVLRSALDRIYAKYRQALRQSADH